MIDIPRMKKIIEEIYPLLEMSGHTSWLRPLKRWYSEIEQFPEEIILEIWGSCGGHSSLTDFALYKNGELLYDETKCLSKLRNELSSLCFEALPEIYSNKKPPKPDSDAEKTE